MRSASYTFQATERIVYGRPAAKALSAEIARLDAQRVFLIGHVLGGTCGVAHGHPRASCCRTSCAITIPPTPTQQLVAAAMGHPEKPAADAIAALVAELGQPGRLSEVNVTRDQFPLIASHTMEERHIRNNPRAITRAEQVLEILEAAA